MRRDVTCAAAHGSNPLWQVSICAPCDRSGDSLATLPATPVAASKEDCALQDEIDAAHERIQSLTHAVALRDELLSIAGHELRNPMHELALHLTLAEKLAERHRASDVIERLQRARRSLDFSLAWQTSCVDME